LWAHLLLDSAGDAGSLAWELEESGMRIFIYWVVAAALALCVTCNTVRADIAGLQRVATGLANPMFVTHAPDDPNRLFIAERGGGIRILNLDTGVVQPTPFLTMTGIATQGEGGFLGLAFHPNYSSEGMPGFGKFYVSVTTAGSPLTSRIREFEVSATDPNLANPGSMREILSFAQPQDNHNGGWIGFSPVDHYLYMSSGDGGGGDDNDSGHTPGTGNAQDITSNLLGKMLRIDVNGDDFPGDANRNYAIPGTNPFKAGVGDPADDVGDDEIWAYGLRNPFRASFDRMTGDLWIGDVGQSAREEIDFQPANSDGGENYGWRLREGLVATPSGGVGGARPPGNVDPVYDYDRNNDPFGGTVVTGGYVYRGPDPSLLGKYFFLDSRNSFTTADDNYWMFDPANPFGTVQNIDSLLPFNTGSPGFPVSFGEDAAGNLYIAYLSGDVYRINTRPPGDYNRDGEVDMADYEVWRAAFSFTPRGNPQPADGNGNGVVDAADYVLWRKNFDAAASARSAVPEPATLILAAATLLWIAWTRR
jgi:glucose/arabinose dehydrogenase